MKKKLLLFMCLILCSAVSRSQGFKVSGNQLLDANGNNFIMKGLNVPLAWFVSDVNSNIGNIKTVTGSNCLRIVVTTTTSDAAWQTCVQNCINNKIIPIVELHDVTGNNTPSELNRMAMFWASKASYLTRPEIAKYILINIANEWSDWNMSANATGSISRITWRDAYITAVKTIRNAGINTTLVVDAAGYGQDNKAQTILGYAKDVQAADPVHNCLFSVHMYCEWSVNGNSSITSLLPAIRNAGIPIIVGEFGYQHTEGGGICDINESQIINTCQANGIGWLAWSWKGNGGGVEFLDLSTNWSGTSLSGWGNTVVNGAYGTKTAVASSVFSVTVNKAPTVSITSPANNASFTGPASILINATAADADGTISNVQFYNGSTLLGSDASSPYSFTWGNVTAGTYILTAKATDNSGATTTSTSVTVVVSQVNTPPTISITSPANNATFNAPASITLNVTASDADGTISNVQFYNGSTLLGSDASSPYSFTWGNVPAGTYVLTAKATDNTGSVTTSGGITVIVTPVSTGISIQCETACSVNGVLNETANAGFRGTGYVNTDNTVGASVSWVINSSATQTVNLSIRYAHNTASGRSMSLSLNGKIQVALIPFPSTGSGTNWTETPVQIILNPGANTLSLASLTSAGSPYLDELVFNSSGISSGTCTTMVQDCNGVPGGTAYVDACGTCVGGSTGKVACSNQSGNCVTNTLPAAKDWIARNDWSDQNSGSGFSNTTDALKVTQRGWGRDYLWLIESAMKRIKAQAGKTYTISFDFKDDVNKVSSLQVGLASSYQWDGPVLAQPAVSVSSGTSSSVYTNKSVTITATVSGDFNLVIREQWPGQPSSAINNYIKNISVCEAAASLLSNAAMAETSLAPNPATSAFTLTAAEQIESFSISNTAGLVVYKGGTISDGEIVIFGESLSAGIYILKIIYTSGRTEAKRIQKL